jgi:hypothetical protein
MAGKSALPILGNINGLADRQPPRALTHLMLVEHAGAALMVVLAAQSCDVL